MPQGQETTEVRANHIFDQSRLEQYLVQGMPGFRAPLSVRQFLGGQSNPTFMLESPAGRFVMRKKPPGTLLQSAHQVEREYKIISALRDTDVPVPRTYLLCEDPGVIGTPFFVMEYVEGRVFLDPLLPESSPAERAAIYDSMNDTMARLHKVDFRAVGLGDFGRPQAYVERQIARWTKQYRAAEMEPIPAMDRLIEWLPQHVPPGDETTIAHGDFRMGNLVYHPTEPRVAAVLDWELSTLGHPLGDLAWNCLGYHYPPGPDYPTTLAGRDYKASGIPAEPDYIATYCRRAGRHDVGDFNFFVAFAFFRSASILQGIAMRAKLGNASGPDAAEHGRRAGVSAELGWAVAQRR